MKVFLCDKCRTYLNPGLMGAYDNVTIDIQPSYAPTEFHVAWHLCQEHSRELQEFLDTFTKKDDSDHE